MLDGKEERFAIRREARSAEFGTDRYTEEMAAGAAALAFGLDGPEAVGGTGIVVAISGDPEAALGIDGAIVRAREPAILRSEGIPGGADFGDGGIAAADEDFPARSFGGEVAARFRDLDDVAEAVRRARVRGIDLIRFAAVIVGEHHPDAAGFCIRLDIFGPVHGRRAKEIAGAASFDQNVCLRIKSVGRRERASAEDEREPGDGAVLVEAGAVERAGIEQIHVGGSVYGVIAPR